MLDDYALASDVGPQFGNVTVGSVSESSNRKITQLVRLAALECAKTTNLRAVPARALPDLYLGIVSKVSHQVRDESPPDRPSGTGAGRNLGAGCAWLWSCRGARRLLVRDCLWRRQRSYDYRG